MGQRELDTAEHTEHPTSKTNTNKKRLVGGFPGGAVGKNLPANAGDTDLIPGL